MINNFNINDVTILSGDEAYKYADDCAEVFDENGQGHILNKQGIYDKDKFNLIVAVYKNKAIAYQLLYIGGNFVKQEGFVNQHNEGRKFENDAVYVWDICTQKCYEGHGVQRKLFNYTLTLFPNKNFYTITDAQVKNSLGLQKSMGFAILENHSFDGLWNGEVCHFHILQRPASNKKLELANEK